jgi:hypothetical protein
MVFYQKHMRFGIINHGFRLRSTHTTIAILDCMRYILSVRVWHAKPQPRESFHTIKNGDDSEN